MTKEKVVSAAAITPRLWLLSLAMMICFSCLASTGWGAELQARLENVIEEGEEALAMPTGQVQVLFPDGRTKLLKFRSHLQPQVIGGKIYIFTGKGGLLTGIAVYDSGRDRAQSYPLPRDLKLNPYFGKPSFSPDGTMVAYYFVSEAEKPSRRRKAVAEPEISFIDRTGKPVNEPPDEEQAATQSGQDNTSDELLIGRGDDGKLGFRDATGKFVIPPQFDNGRDFSEGLALVQVGEKWGFIDKTGKFVIPPQYVEAGSFREGLARVNPGGKFGYGKWGFIDKSAKMVIPPQYADADDFSEGLARVAVAGKYGFIDQTGKMVIAPQYDLWTGNFSQGVAKVVKSPQSECCGGGVRVRSWPGWRLLWQSPLYHLAATDWPPQPPIWENNSLVEFDPRFFLPPVFLSFRVPGK